MRVYETIREAMAKAFFADMLCQQFEEARVKAPWIPGSEVLDHMPATVDPCCCELADTLIDRLIKAAGKEENLLTTDRDAILVWLYIETCHACEGQGDREHTLEVFGHYAAMSAMGHGIGLREAFGDRYKRIFAGRFDVECCPVCLSKDYVIEDTP